MEIVVCGLLHDFFTSVYILTESNRLIYPRFSNRALQAPQLSASPHRRVAFASSSSFSSEEYWPAALAARHQALQGMSDHGDWHTALIIAIAHLIAIVPCAPFVRLLSLAAIVDR